MFHAAMRSILGIAISAALVGCVSITVHSRPIDPKLTANAPVARIAVRSPDTDERPPQPARLGNTLFERAELADPAVGHARAPWKHSYFRAGRCIGKEPFDVDCGAAVSAALAGGTSAPQIGLVPQETSRLPQTAVGQAARAKVEPSSIAAFAANPPQTSENQPAEAVTANNSTNDQRQAGWQPHGDGRSLIRTTTWEFGEEASLSDAPQSDDVPSAEGTNPDGVDINLTTALALVAGQSPQVAFAHERIQEAFARWDATKVLWLPSVRAGLSFNRHDGTLQNSGGTILDVNRSSLQTGFGINAVGAGTQAIPGLWAQFHLSDAIFQPRIAERTVTARQHAATAANHDQLLAAALAYLEFLRAIEQRTIALATLQNAQQLAELTATFARTGQGAQADADRARAEQSIRQNDVARASEAIGVTLARLAEVLSLDPSLPLRTQEAAVVPIELVALETPVQELLASALATRPELAESQVLISETVQRLQREKYAPLIPSVLLGMSYAGFGGGIGDTINSFHDRVDLDVGAFWEVRNLGFGEKAARDEMRSRVRQARIRQVQLMDRVARGVVEAHAQVQSRQTQIETARTAIGAAEDSFRRDHERIRDGQGLPIEVLQSLQALDQARREYLRAVVDYDQAQFRLHRALGWPTEPSGAATAL